MGSFSDISIIVPELKVAAVNISAGYYCEHSRYEYVDLRVVEKNIGLVGKMVSAPSEKFEYMEAVYFRHSLWAVGFMRTCLTSRSIIRKKRMLKSNL